MLYSSVELVVFRKGNYPLIIIVYNYSYLLLLESLSQESFKLDSLFYRLCLGYSLGFAGGEGDGILSLWGLANDTASYIKNKFTGRSSSILIPRLIRI